MPAHGPAHSRIPLNVPALHGNELRYLEECITTNWVSYLGPFVDRFEKEFAKVLGSGHAVALSSGTSALHIALTVAGVRPGDAVIIPDLTFIATANAVTYCGASPILMDVTAAEGQLDVEKLGAFLRNECEVRDNECWHNATKKRIRAVLPVHLLGHPVDMDPLTELAAHYGLRVIEDAAESLGSRYRKRAAGTLGDCSAFSFNGNKIITAGGGGMFVSRSHEWAARARYLSTQARDEGLEYIHRDVGYNYRLTNLQAAVGLAQLERLEIHVGRKREIARRYREGLDGVRGICLPVEASWAYSNFWLYTVMVDASARLSSRQLIGVLAEEGIEARPLWAPVHQQAPYRASISYRLEESTRLYERGVSLPSSVDLSADEQERVVSTIRGELT